MYFSRFQCNHILQCSDFSIPIFRLQYSNILLLSLKIRNFFFCLVIIPPCLTDYLIKQLKGTVFQKSPLCKDILLKTYILILSEHEQTFTCDLSLLLLLLLNRQKVSLGRNPRFFRVNMFVLHKNILSVTQQNLSLYNLAIYCITLGHICTRFPKIIIFQIRWK